MTAPESFRVFLAGVIQGSIAEKAIHSQQWREPIKEILERHHSGAEIYCHFSENPDSIGYDHKRMVSTFEYGNRMAASSDLVVCWLPQASMGTAVEMYMAWKAGAAVVAITPMDANWVIRTCSDVITADLEQFEQFVSSDEFAVLLRASRKRRVDMNIARQLPEMDEFWADGD